MKDNLMAGNVTELVTQLAPMTSYLRKYWQNQVREPLAQAEFRQSLADFCLGYSPEFIAAFGQAVGVEVSDDLDSTKPQKSPKPQKLFPAKDSSDDLVKSLSQYPGDAVFLFRDAYLLWKSYRQQTGRGLGININRDYLSQSRSPSDYFVLVAMLYEALSKSSSWSEFLHHYELEFRDLVTNDRFFWQKSQEIYRYIMAFEPRLPLVWVDTGYQLTLCLFCYASVSYHHPSPVQQFLKQLASHAWLPDFFHENTLVGQKFTGVGRKSFINVPSQELQARQAYQSELEDRAATALLGFGIGDAMGFPMAGIDASQARDFISLPLTGFTDNPNHPHFDFLKPGQYTSNTILLKLTAKHLIQCGGFDEDKYKQKLESWGKNVLGDRQQERWLGPTTGGALQRLVAGVASPGDRQTKSCAATYRLIPLGLFYRPFACSQSWVRERVCEKRVHEMACERSLVCERLLAHRLFSLCASLTHDSPLSKVGAIWVAELVGLLAQGVWPDKAVDMANKLVLKDPIWQAESLDSGGLLDNDDLLDKGHSLDNNGSLNNDDSRQVLHTSIKQAQDLAKNKVDDNQARQELGTGASLLKTLPLSIFYLLKYKHSFRQGVLAAAGSWRRDDEAERRRLAGLSWEEQLVAADGGNCDGIAALVGSFLGASLGLEAIPTSWREQVEQATELDQLGRGLVGGLV